MLSFLGPAWAQAPPRFSNEKAAAITQGIVEKGGAVTWDVPIAANGAIAPEFIAQFAAIHQALAAENK
jgi:hypothetical protein